jgi:G6PDH family F420-dependent oxidoreductase
MSFVTCPVRRYHPAVIAQAAATVASIAPGRFTLGVGAGENLNEHIAGPWPYVTERHDMLVEALEIIRELHTGELVDYAGDFFEVDSARIWDLPDGGVPLALAVSGEASVSTFAPLSDHLIAVEPESDFVNQWNSVEGAPQIPGKARAIGQIPICWDPDEDTAVKRAHEQFRWFAGGWGVNADLPTTAGFAAATQFVREEDVAENIACGPDLDKIAGSVLEFAKAGFTDVALVQIGGDTQDQFLEEAAGPLLEKLRSA